MIFYGRNSLKSVIFETDTVKSLEPLIGRNIELRLDNFFSFAIKTTNNEKDRYRLIV